MKKQIFLLIALIFGASFESFAGTGGAADGLYLLLTIIGFLCVVLLLFAGGEFLKKNGKRLIYRTISSVKKMIISLKEYLRGILSEYLDPSWL